MPFTADQLFQTFPRGLRPLLALFTTFLVCQISRVLNIVDGSRLNTSASVRNIKEKNYFSNSFIVSSLVNWLIT